MYFVRKQKKFFIKILYKNNFQIKEFKSNKILQVINYHLAPKYLVYQELKYLPIIKESIQ